MRSTVDARKMWRGWILRGVGLLGFWLLIAGSNPVDLPAGVVAAIIATWVSVLLLPPGTWKLRPVALTVLAFRFLYQSTIAGVDVAWRALDPRLPLRPGFVAYRPRSPPGAAQNLFYTITSLLPGTLPCGSGEDGLVIHCLDVTQPVAERLAAEEARLLQATGGTQ